MTALLIATVNLLLLVVGLVIFSGLCGVMFGLFGLASGWVVRQYQTIRYGETTVDEDNWAFVVGMVAAIIWCLYGIHFICTTTDPAIKDVIHRVTFGYTAKGYPDPVPVTVVKTEVRRYELTGMNPPKHFYVSLEDVVTHQVYQGQYVSKHCNAYADNKIGTEYNLQVTTLQQGSNKWLRFDNLYSAFC